MDIHIFGSFLGQLLLRTLERAHRIYTAMTSRGYEGAIPQIRKDTLKPVDIFYSAGWIALFILFRIYDISEILGALVLGSSG
jgi:cobalt/nickel transport system permease protein